MMKFLICDGFQLTIFYLIIVASGVTNIMIKNKDDAINYLISKIKNIK